MDASVHAEAPPVTLLTGDCLTALPSFPEASFDACVTDPPYELAFMGRAWDRSGVAFDPETWRAVLRVLKPGAHLLAFGGTRTAHRMTCAIEDAGFEVRDTLCWLYGSGFPKSLDVSKAIDKAAGAVREVTGTRELTGKARVLKGGNYDGGYDGRELTTEYNITVASTPAAQRWQGWGTALKPAHEPIILARKPFPGTVARNVLAHGTGAINVDACRVETTDSLGGGDLNGKTKTKPEGWDRPWMHDQDAKAAHAKRVAENVTRAEALGRWPANVVHDGSPEVEAAFATFGKKSSGVQTAPIGTGGIWSGKSNMPCGPQYADTGTASRFYYSAKASTAERAGNKHPTVKPLALMRWLVRMVTPPGGVILDPFAGSGTTGLAARAEGFASTLIEKDDTNIDGLRLRVGPEIEMEWRV